ncbi:MAG: D-alanine--D-alanine ligase [Bacteriovoracaceae bacterium]
MKISRVLVLVHRDLVPPENTNPKDVDRETTEWLTEFDVIYALKKTGHEVKVLGVYSDLIIIKNAIDEFKPHIVFNLLEEFDGEVLFDQNVVSYLELLRVPYTGCNPRGLMLCRDKALSKKIVMYHRIKSPRFYLGPKSRRVKRPKHLEFPLIVKCNTEEASLAISQASIVHNEEKLNERLDFINSKIGVDAIIEEFIEGRELYVGILGNYRLQALPVWEIVYDNADKPEKEIYSRNAKWNKRYRERKGVGTKKAELSKEDEFKIQEQCKRIYRALGLNGYARIDLRISQDGTVYFLEANPNPNIAYDDEFALSAAHINISYNDLLDRILNLGLK